MKFFNRYAIVGLLFIVVVNKTFANNTNKNNNKKPEHFVQNAKDLLLKGNFSEAQVNARKALHLSQPGSLLYEEASVILSTTLYNLSNYNASIHFCDSILNLTPKSTDLTIALSVQKFKAQLALKSDTAVVQSFKKLIQSIISSPRKDLKANAYYVYGTMLNESGAYFDALNYLDSGLILKTKISDSVGMAACHSFIGLVYSNLGNYNKALDHLQASIQIREKYKDKRGLANSYLNLYRIYINTNNLQKAKESEQKSLEICREIGDLQCVTGRLTNLGYLLYKQNNFEQALMYQMQALKLSRELKLINREAQILENLGTTYAALKQYKKAEELIDSSLAIRNNTIEKEGICSALIAKAKIENEQKKYTQAKTLILQAIEKSTEIKSPLLLNQALEIAHQIYLSSGDSKQAYYLYNRYINLRDSLFNAEKSKEITTKELTFEYQKQQEERLKEEKRQEELSKIEAAKNQTIKIILIIAILVFVAISIYMFKLYRVKSAINQKLFQANFLLNEKNEEIAQQHHLLSEKTKEINESIAYAANIQKSLIPDTSELIENFLDGFVFFKPREIISGDFYWFSKQENSIIYATADCTGHGVPGGFMSMMGIALLNEIVNDKKINEPADVLNNLRLKIIQTLNNHQVSNKDGMDIALVRINTNGYLGYSGANNPLWILLNKKVTDISSYSNHKLLCENELHYLIEVTASKMPVGKFFEDTRPFNQHEMVLPAGSWVYTFTDGLADQFGGDKGKKLKYKSLADFILNCNEKKGDTQKELLEKFFAQWKRHFDQVDDILFIGVKV